jgi:tRNA(adenine34) deaminase
MEHRNENFLPLIRNSMILSQDPATEDDFFMALALAQAEAAFAQEEVPVGALIVRDGLIISAGYNQREASQDPTAHAEILAIRRAASVLGSWRLTDATLYVTLEPCPMCIGAVLQARIARLVFGAWDPKAGACGSLCNIPADTRFNHRVSVKPECRASESRRLLQTFFRQLRQNQSAVPIDNHSHLSSSYAGTCSLHLPEHTR